MHINDSWRIQRESVLSSHIYHLVWFSNLVGPFVSYIRNHLIESPKSISLHFQLAYCCPFRLIAYNDSLMSGISKSVFGGSDYISKNCYFYLPITEKHFSLCSRASLSSACLSPASFPSWRADGARAPARPWLGSFLPEAPIRAAPKHRAFGDLWGI